MSNKTWLPATYEVPEKNKNYMKWVKGENRFRVLSDPIIGWLGWKTDSEDKRHPVRKGMDEKFQITEVDDPEECKHFMTFVVYNYAREAIQILEITQRGIQQSLKKLSADSDWGVPTEYDIIVTKDGEGMETKYETFPKPKKPMDIGIARAYVDMHINLDALFTGDDPFADTADSSQSIADDAGKAGL